MSLTTLCKVLGLCAVAVVLILASTTEDLSTGAQIVFGALSGVFAGWLAVDAGRKSAGRHR